MHNTQQSNTRFSDLPPDLQKKLVDLNNQKLQKINHIPIQSIDSFDDLLLKIKALPVENLRKSMIRLADYIQEIQSGEVDRESLIENIEKTLVDLRNKVRYLSDSLDSPDFLAEMHEVYLILSGKYEKIFHDKKPTFFNE